MERRTFLATAFAAALVPEPRGSNGERLAAAAERQLGVTTGYDPAYARMAYPGGDVPQTTGVCADVVVRAVREALQLDLQKLVHEDMQHAFAAYPRTWGMHAPDANIDHRRVLNLEVFWRRANAQLWFAKTPTAGDDFPAPLLPGDLLTWRLDARLPHVGIVTAARSFPTGTMIVHNIGGGVQRIALSLMRGQRAAGHFRWPT